MIGIDYNKKECIACKEYDKSKKIQISVFILAITAILISSIFIYGILSKDNLNDITYQNSYLLTDIIGIGDGKAELIIENKPYNNWRELKTLNGIGDKTIYKLKQKFYIRKMRNKQE